MLCMYNRLEMKNRLCLFVCVCYVHANEPRELKKSSFDSLVFT